MIRMFLSMCMLLCTSAVAQGKQSVEGFDKVAFHNDLYRPHGGRDFRGSSEGFMTADWWSPEQMKTNYVSWYTAAVPEDKETTFYFIGASSVLPMEFSRGPVARLSVNGKASVDFTIGMNRNATWKGDGLTLRYVSKRVEYPYANSQREFDLNGNSGIYELTVPASMLEAGKPALLKVELMPFARWHNGWFMVKNRHDVLKQTMETQRGEIDALQQDVTTLNMQTEVLATQLYAKMLGNDRFENGIAYTDGDRHLHPADLVRLQNGDILLTAREATEHISADGDVIMLRSHDNGRTWGEKQVIANDPHLDEREACGVQLKDGTIVYGVFYNNMYRKDGTYLFGMPGAEAKAENAPHFDGAYTIRSTDNGKTWSKPVFVDTDKFPFREMEGPTDAPIEMPDGSLIMAMTGYRFGGDPKNKAAVLLRSKDKGVTWSFVSAIAPDPGGEHNGFVEPGIARTKTGRLVTAMRVESGDDAVWTTYSDDDGKTWAPVQHTEMIGHPADILQLADGRLLMSYGQRPQHARPGGIRACFSKDDGKTWEISTEVIIRNDFFNNWDVGYPESTQLPDGKILTVYYFNLFQRYYLGYTIWNASN